MHPLIHDKPLRLHELIRIFHDDPRQLVDMVQIETGER